MTDIERKIYELKSVFFNVGGFDWEALARHVIELELKAKFEILKEIIQSPNLNLRIKELEEKLKDEDAWNKRLDQ